MFPSITSPVQATAHTTPPSAAAGRLAGRALPLAAACWCVVAVLGQLMFAAYVVLLYGRAAATGQFEQWNKVMPRGYVAGDTVANVVMGLHLLFTVVVVVGGAIQMLPLVRRRAPAFHRWNGRLYLISALLLAAGGLTMMWTRGTVGALSQHVATSLNAVLIMSFAGLAWWHAVTRRFNSHRRWALRLWVTVAGVWFFRIGLMAWLVLNQGPVGFNPKTFEGPFLSFLAFAQFLLPLAVLELYLRVRDRGAPRARLAVAAGLGGLTLLTALGIGAATMIMWLPRIQH